MLGTVDWGGVQFMNIMIIICYYLLVNLTHQVHERVVKIVFVDVFFLDEVNHTPMELHHMKPGVY